MLFHFLLSTFKEVRIKYYKQTDRAFKKVLIFRDKQTHMHHNIYITIIAIIIAIMIINICKTSSRSCPQSISVIVQIKIIAITRLRRIPPNLLDNTTNLLDLLLHSNRWPSQGSTKCATLPSQMGEHGVSWENMENTENIEKIETSTRWLKSLYLGFKTIFLWL